VWDRGLGKEEERMDVGVKGVEPLFPVHPLGFDLTCLDLLSREAELGRSNLLAELTDVLLHVLCAMVQYQDINAAHLLHRLRNHILTCGVGSQIRW